MPFNLMRGEKILWDSYPAKKYRLLILLRDIFLGISSFFTVYYLMTMVGLTESKINLWGALFFLLIWTILGLVNQLNLIFIHYAVTDERILIKRGIFFEKIKSIRVENVIDTKVTQNIFEKIFNIGTIYFFTANDSNGTDGGLHKVPRVENIENPKILHTIICEFIEEEINK